MFKILKLDKHSNARLGILSTPHGKIETPSYVIVATHAQIKCLKPSDIKKTKTQIVISNTYHLWNRALKIKNSKLKIHGILGAKIPVMTDSGGFQVFSLGFGQENKVGKILKPANLVWRGTRAKPDLRWITDIGSRLSTDERIYELPAREFISGGMEKPDF